jgi:ubiquinone/menaquinone biosynthesis C-methylase UbiE
VNSKTRFSTRVENYVKYRPGYPAEAINFLYDKLRINEQSVIAEIGSGTGIFTRQIIEKAGKIYAVEPNKEMREAAEKSLIVFNNLISIDASAENTSLQDHSVDFVISAQAFHWFDRIKAKKEFNRILKSDGIVILLWNNRLFNTDFLKQYEIILKKYANDYNEVNHLLITEKELSEFYSQFEKITFSNKQTFNYEGLIGRLLSSSYVPMPGEKNHDILFNEIENIYNLYSEDGKVDFNYITELYWGYI